MFPLLAAATAFVDKYSFKGNEVTFESFPDRECFDLELQSMHMRPTCHMAARCVCPCLVLIRTGVCHLLRETHPTLRVESRVFPAYQTRGDLVRAFATGPGAQKPSMSCRGSANRTARSDTRLCRLADDARRRAGGRSWCRRGCWKGAGRADGPLVRAICSWPYRHLRGAPQS